MLTCPRCGSPNVVSNRYDDTQLERVNFLAKATQAFGIRRLSIFASAGAVLFRAFNEYLNAWKCTDCCATFDAGPDHGLQA